MAYATASNLISQFDARILGDLAEDTGTRLTPTQILSDANIAYALSRASGEINAACQVGERYTPADLAALSGDDAAILQGLCCDLAFVFLCQRRGITSPLFEAASKRSTEMLQHLRDGALIFNVSADVNSGVASAQFPSLVDYQTLNLLRDQASSLFPLRRPQNPIG